MSNRAPLAVAAAILGVILVVVSIVYFTSTAHGLPSFFPGHVSAAHGAGATHHHAKHGIAALVVALACFAFAWFATGPAGRGTESTDAGVQSTAP